jgi:hypothetical protein
MISPILIEDEILVVGQIIPSDKVFDWIEREIIFPPANQFLPIKICEGIFLLPLSVDEEIADFVVVDSLPFG